MFDQIYVIIVAIIVFIAGLLTFSGTSIKSERFVDLNSIANIDATINIIIHGVVSMDNAKNNLVQIINPNLQCGNKTSLPVPEIYAPGLKHTCVYNKKITGTLMDDPNYKFSYSLRDLLTTIYIRSFEAAGAKNIQETRSFSLRLSKAFNDGIEKFLQAYNTGYGTNYSINDLAIVYKGGNVIAIYTRALVDKLLPNIRKSANISFLKSKIQELKRGDWDYTMALRHDLLGTDIDKKAQTFVIFLMKSLKEYLDTHDVFKMKTIAQMIQREFLNSSDVQSFSRAYGSSISSSVAVEKVEINGYTITSKTITTNGAANIPSKYSLHRPGANITDTFQVDSLYLADPNPMQETNVSIGFIEDISSMYTYMKTHFDLARLKFNNKVTVNIDDSRVERNFSADIVDMSFIKDDDTKSSNVHKKLGNLREYTLRRLGEYNIPFYTSHYLFYDLNNMLVEEGVYVWSDKKYAKRVDRFITIGIVSSLITGTPDKIYRYLVAARDFIKSLDLDDLDAAYDVASQRFTIKPSLDDFSFGLATNHVTHEIIKSFVKTLIFHRFINHNATMEEQAYTETILHYVFTGESQIPIEGFMNPVDVDRFIGYQEFVLNQLDRYIDVFSEIRDKDIIMTDFDTLSIDKL